MDSADPQTSNGNASSSQMVSSLDSNGTVPSEAPERVRFPRISTRRFYSCMCCSNHILDIPRPTSNRLAVVFLVCRYQSLFAYLLMLSCKKMLNLETVFFFLLFAFCFLKSDRRVICNSTQLVNVWFDSPDNFWVYDDDGRHVFSVYCNRCNEPIGYRMLTVGQASNEPVLLYRSRLLLWDGDFTIYADTYRIADVGND
ncbi:hypothetical protein V6N12_047539 [Hibiscus sabdariffa]|uniref:Uncharacterized protein n=1 Tax=Hibiscus sabdariffa TaxID=183260 RepID=A0ABR2DB69_9ROSI